MGSADYANLNDYDLVTQLGKYQREALNRKLIGLKAEVGRYTAGVDIPAGSYRVELIDGNTYGVELKVYSAFEKSKLETSTRSSRNTPQAKLDYYVHEALPAIGQVHLLDGDLIDICSSNGRGFLLFMKFAGLQAYTKLDVITDEIETTE